MQNRSKNTKNTTKITQFIDINSYHCLSADYGEHIDGSSKGI